MCWTRHSALGPSGVPPNPQRGTRVSPTQAYLPLHRRARVSLHASSSRLFSHETDYSAGLFSNVVKIQPSASAVKIEQPCPSVHSIHVEYWRVRLRKFEGKLQADWSLYQTCRNNLAPMDVVAFRSLSASFRRATIKFKFKAGCTAGAPHPHTTRSSFLNKLSPPSFIPLLHPLL